MHTQYLIRFGRPFDDALAMQRYLEANRDRNLKERDEELVQALNQGATLLAVHDELGIVGVAAWLEHERGVGGFTRDAVELASFHVSVAHRGGGVGGALAAARIAHLLLPESAGEVAVFGALRRNATDNLAILTMKFGFIELDLDYQEAVLGVQRPDVAHVVIADPVRSRIAAAERFLLYAERRGWRFEGTALLSRLAHEFLGR